MPLSGLLKGRKIHDGCWIGNTRKKRGLISRFMISCDRGGSMASVICDEIA